MSIHNHRREIIDGVQFNFSGDVLQTVAYDRWPFPIEDDGSLGYPGGYPMPESLLNQVVTQGLTGQQLNDEMKIARDICQTAYEKYLASRSTGTESTGSSQ